MDERLQEVPRHLPGCLFMKLGYSKLRSPVDGHQKIELAPPSANLSEINVKVAQRMDFELLFIGLIACNIGQTGDTVALKTSVE